MSEKAPIVETAEPPKQIMHWHPYVVGKPAFNYAPFDHQFHGTILDWNFAGMTREQMIAKCAQVSKYMSTLEKWVETAKTILKDQAPALGLKVGDAKEVSGAAGWVANYAYRERISLDTEAVKAEMGEAWFAAHCKSTEYYEIRFKQVK
jgi:hypothetical protein